MYEPNQKSKTKRMNHKTILHLGTICLVISFLTLTYLSVLKFMKRDTSYHISYKDQKNIMYPSVSVCKKYAFDKEYLKFENKSIQEIIDMVLKYSWSIDDQFYFFTHPGVMNLTFPCTTTLGGISPGKPCVFPFISALSDEIYDTCQTEALETTRPACLTKVGEHNEYYQFEENWGYCPENCKGEAPGPTSPWNLAKSKYSDIWTSFFYDLSSWENGLCHTYDPPETSSPDFLDRIYFLIAPIEAWSKDYDIFIHEKGQFWPRSNMFSYGQPNKVLVRNEMEIEIVFSSKVSEKMKTKENPCIEDNSYSFTQCIQEFTRKKTKCKFYVHPIENQSSVNCDEGAFIKYMELLVRIKQSRITDIQEETGCYPKCQIVQYSYEIVEKDLNWAANWTAEVFIQPKSSIVEKTQEYYSFDSNDLISSIGGNLGLFLGWSLLTVMQTLSLFACICKERMINRK